MDSNEGSGPSSQKDAMRQKAMCEKEKGNSSFNNGQYQEAIEHYTNGVRCDPTEPTILCNRAMAYLKLKEYAKAKIDCDLAVALDPTYVKAIYRRALAYSGMNDTEGARTNFRRVLELEPSNRQAQDELKKLESNLSTRSSDASTVSKSSEAKYDPLLVLPVKDPPAEWKTQALTRISIEEVASSMADASIHANGDHSVEMAASPAPSTDMDVPPPPTTSVEFFSRWGTIRRRNKPDIFEKYFMSIPPESYQNLFGRLIESDILSDVIRAFGDTIRNSDSSMETVISVSQRLLQLSQLERFQVAYGFLDDTDLKAVKDIIGRLEDFAKTNQDQKELMDLVRDLKAAFVV